MRLHFYRKDMTFCWFIRTIDLEKYSHQVSKEPYENHPDIAHMKALAKQNVWWPI